MEKQINIYYNIYSRPRLLPSIAVATLNCILFHNDTSAKYAGKSAYKNQSLQTFIVPP